MTYKTPITQDILISKFRNFNTSDVYRLDKKSDQVLWVLLIIKKSFQIENFIPISVLTSILVDALGISITENTLKNTLNPLRNKIHSKVIEEELSYKIMHEGIAHVEKLIKKKKPEEITPTANLKLVEREEHVRDAISTIHNLGRKKHLSAGLYYVVLIDLVGSTTASTKMTPDENKKRIKQFIQFTKDALSKSTKDIAVFINDKGDGALFLFRNFQDILDWAEKIDKLCDQYNRGCIKSGKQEIYQMYSRKCVHLGEVHFNEPDNAIALAINQISKIEKEFKKVQLGITDIVKQVILPRVNSGELKANKIKNVKLHGEKQARPIWNIAY
ncbi:MAG TPA: hypothetical protein VGR54_07165 [Nitrosopumilaceae archaeon]|nr:hypothetical protein [Nitrosopumilaceae archaeon]